MQNMGFLEYIIRSAISAAIIIIPIVIFWRFMKAHERIANTLENYLADEDEQENEEEIEEEKQGANEEEE